VGEQRVCTLAWRRGMHQDASRLILICIWVVLFVMRGRKGGLVTVLCVVWIVCHVFWFILFCVDGFFSSGFYSSPSLSLHPPPPLSVFLSPVKIPSVAATLSRRGSWRTTPL
jgi:hypothetical protein